MTEYFIDNANKCCKEFQLLLESNKYINRKLYDDFLDKYEDTFNYINKNDINLDPEIKIKFKSIISNGYLIIEKRNKKFVEKKLMENKEYFDNMFKLVDDNILLDDDQRKAIILDEDYSLVIAGAGSGKTTTMAAKVKYLIEKCNVDPKKIILLAFTNKAALELDSRINSDFKLNVEVLTFHKLGMRFIRKIYNQPISIVKEGTAVEIVSDYIKKIVFPNKEKLKEFTSVFKKYVSFDDSVLEYNNFDEYFKHYADRLYEENKNNLDQYISDRVQKRLENKRTITGEYLRSQGEVGIANYLYRNGYDYKYEKMYPHKVNEGRSYIPDFTIENNGLETYIEYYGLTTYSKNGDYSLDDIKAYNNLIKKKRELHKKYNTDLIEIYSKYDNGKTFMSALVEELNNRNIDHTPRTQKEIFYKLIYSNERAQFFKFINLCTIFINRFKEKGYTEEDFDMLIENEKNSDMIEQLKFLKPIFRYYEHSIHSESKVDFNDMINYAYRGMERVKNKYKYLNYDYIIIDEYQDISTQRYNFARKISDLFSAKIVAVGDDWQAIFEFSGSDVKLFTKFYDLMGYAEIVKIVNTYRNSQELIDTAGEFVSKNEEQFNKSLISNKHLDKPIEIDYFDYDNIGSEIDKLEEVIGKIYNENNNYKILILGRYSDDVKIYLESNRFRMNTVSDKLFCLKYPNAQIDFMTVHKAKGLGYDQVILINAINSKYGFPSQIEDELLLKTLNDDKIEFIEYPEERRLFYVALTRTKNKIYILCPYKPNEKRSDFINEIINNENVMEVM